MDITPIPHDAINPSSFITPVLCSRIQDIQSGGREELREGTLTLFFFAIPDLGVIYGHSNPSRPPTNEGSSSLTSHCNSQHISLLHKDYIQSRNRTVPSPSPSSKHSRIQLGRTNSALPADVVSAKHLVPSEHVVSPSLCHRESQPGQRRRRKRSSSGLWNNKWKKSRRNP